MRLASQLGKPTVFMLGLAVGVALAWSAKPLYQRGLQNFFRSDFYNLTESCDNAMRVHLVAKNKLDLEPSEKNVSTLKSAELGLLACQDYDLMRKRLIRLGIDENSISEMTLSFAEDRAKDLQLVVRTHEFSY